jgi:hypothetical protein
VGKVVSVLSMVADPVGKDNVAPKCLFFMCRLVPNKNVEYFELFLQELLSSIPLGARAFTGPPYSYTPPGRNHLFVPGESVAVS